MAVIYSFISPSGKRYIGLTSSTMERRWRQHITLYNKLRRNKIEYRGASATPILFYAFDKYPPDQWSKEILFETENLEEAKQKEIEFIDQYKTTNSDFGYNVLIGGQTGWAGKNLSKKHKEAQSKSLILWYDTEEGKVWKQKLSERWANTENNPSTLKIGQPGMKHTEETKEKIRQSKIGLKYSDETKKKQSIKKKIFYESEKGILDRQKRSDKLKENPLPIRIGFKQPQSQKEKVATALAQRYLIIKPNGEQEEIENLNKYCRDNNLHVGNMCSVASGKLKQYKGYKAQKITI